MSIEICKEIFEPYFDIVQVCKKPLWKTKFGDIDLIVSGQKKPFHYTLGWCKSSSDKTSKSLDYFKDLTVPLYRTHHIIYKDVQVDFNV